MTMNQNVVILAGRVAGVSQRPVGAQGRSLYEVKMDVTRPASRGREAEVMTVPIIVWAPEIGLAAETLDPAAAAALPPATTAVAPADRGDASHEQH
jgi:hypothetical protein